MEESLKEALESLKHVILSMPTTLKEALGHGLAPKEEGAKGGETSPDLARKGHALASSFSHLADSLRRIKVPAILKEGSHLGIGLAKSVSEALANSLKDLPRADTAKATRADYRPQIKLPDIATPLGKMVTSVTSKMANIKAPDLSKFGQTIQTQMSRMKLPDIQGLMTGIGEGIKNQFARIKFPNMSKVVDYLKIQAKGSKPYMMISKNQHVQNVRSVLKKGGFGFLHTANVHTNPSRLQRWKTRAGWAKRKIRNAAAWTTTKVKGFSRATASFIPKAIGAVGSVITKVGSALSPVVAVITAITEVVKKAIGFIGEMVKNVQAARAYALQANAGNLKYARFNGPLFYEQAILRMSEFMRTRKLANATSASATILARQTNRMQDAFLPWDQMSANITNDLGTLRAWLAGTMASWFSFVPGAFHWAHDKLVGPPAPPGAVALGPWHQFMKDAAHMKPARRPMDAPGRPKKFHKLK